MNHNFKLVLMGLMLLVLSGCSTSKLQEQQVSQESQVLF